MHRVREMVVYLKLKKQPGVPIEAEAVTPETFLQSGTDGISSMKVTQGNRIATLGEFFDVSGHVGSSVSNTQVLVSGDLRRVKMIGKGMNGGTIEVDGSAGMYLGAEMSAGRIIVRGSVGSWAGAEMSGGNIQIEGNAADHLCTAYRGSEEGMRGGRVYVAGDVGDEMAAHMRKGFISVRGNVGSHAASRMTGGTIVIVGDVSDRISFEATGGMSIILGKLHDILPTFRFSGVSEREFTHYYLRYVVKHRPDFITETIDASEKWIKFMGDFSEGRPQHELYLRASQNRHLLPGSD